MTKLTNGTGGGGGGFLTPKDYETAKAILFEPTKLKKDQPGKFGIRDIVVADVTVFPSIDSLRGDADPILLPGSSITATKVVEDLGDQIGGAVVGTFHFLPNSKGSHPIAVIRQVDPAIFEMAAAYLEKRDAAVAAVIADEPDWMK